MTRTSQRLATAVFTTAIALSASNAFAQGGGYQWNKSGETTSRGTVSETTETVSGVSANALYLTRTGDTREGAVATAKRGQVIGVHPNAYYTAQNGDADRTRDDSWQFADIY